MIDIIKNDISLRDQKMSIYLQTSEQSRKIMSFVVVPTSENRRKLSIFYQAHQTKVFNQYFH